MPNPEKGWISEPAMKENCLTANTAGRAIMADEFINNAKLADGAVGATAKIADAIITAAKFTGQANNAGYYGTAAYGYVVYA